MRHGLILMLSVTAIMIGGQAMAGTREDVLAGTARCGAISDDRVWLDCYYGAAQPMRSHFGLTPAPDFQVKLVPGTGAAPAFPAPSQTASIAPPPPQKNSGGGLAEALFGGKVLIGKTRLSAYSFDKKGMLTVTLVDGEVWQQMLGDDKFAKWNGPASRYIVIIKEGALGSANLQAQGDDAEYKVRRIH